MRCVGLLPTFNTGEVCGSLANFFNPGEVCESLANSPPWAM